MGSHRPGGRAPSLVRSVPCPECGVDAGSVCLTRTGKPLPAYHKERKHYYRTGELPDGTKHELDIPEHAVLCPRPVVPCWMKCNPLPRRCEFCGVCDDPGCGRVHSGPKAP